MRQGVQCSGLQYGVGDVGQRRANGEPVLIPRIRLLISDDPHDAWQVRLELVDATDSMLWCTADQVWDRSPEAIEVARGEAALPPVLVHLADAPDDQPE